MARQFRKLRDVMRVLPEDGRARHLIRQFNQSFSATGKVPSVHELATGLGFDVLEKELPRGMVGRLAREPFAENFYRIEVSPSHSVLARRWAALHEIAHYYLHEDKDDFLSSARPFDPSCTHFYADLAEEQEANAFAEAVIFGDGKLLALVSQLGRDLPRLSRRFGVSERVVEIALTRYA